ncbi:MAG: ABC transporter permease [Bauldia sp.]|nr:ABC transporter permease [Bauldia sp.]
MRRTALLSVLVPVGVLALTVLAWHLVVTLGDVETYDLPAPALVVETLFRDWSILGPALWVTLKLTFTALALAVVGGVALAVLMAQSRWIALALYPYAVILQVTPVVALAPIIVTRIPDTQTALLVLAFVVAFFPILTNTAQGLRSVDHNLRDWFDLNGAGRLRRLWHLEAPSALPYFLTGLRIAGGIALIAAVVAEFAAGSSGAGSGLAFRLFEAQYRLNTPRVFAALLLLAITGVAIFALTSLLSAWALRNWHESAVPRDR